MGVGAEGKARVIVSQCAGQRLDVHAVLEGQRGEGVSEVVEAYVLRADSLQYLFVGVTEGVRVKHGAGFRRYEQVRAVGMLAMFLHQQLHRPLRDGQFADGVGRFGLADHQFTVETVVLLSHKKPDGHINVKVEFGEGEGKVPLDNIAKRAESYKPKERVTYKMIKEYIEAKYGFKVHTAYIAEVKRDLGLPMYDAPNAVEELKQPRKHPTAEKVEAIKDALKHFEVI